MACLNAFGEYMPPLIVYPGQRIRDTVLSGFESAIYGTSKNGWMDSDLFVAFLEHFERFISVKQIQRPVVLIVDGHSTHMSLPAATFCAEHGIVLYCLLANATHVLQACDIGLFSPMKTKWRQTVKEWQMKHLGKCFTKTHFPEVFKTTWDSVCTLSNSVNAFKRSGLFPLSPKGIDQSKLSPSEMIIDDVQSSTAIATSSLSEEVTPVVGPSGDVASTPAVTAVVVPTPVSVAGAVHETAHTDDVEVPSTSTTTGVTQAPSSHEEIPVTDSSASASVSASNSSATVIFTSKGPLNVQASTSNIIRPKGDPNFVSPAFHHLRVPEIKKKKVSTLRNKLPKALSGSVALKMLKEREESKKKEEEAKLVRKAERERKKRERDDEKERKKREREVKKKIKLLEKQKQKQRDSDSDSTEENIPYMDDSDDDNWVRCPVCLSGEGAEWEWIGCEECPLWWHIDCTGRDDLYGKRAGSLKNVNFVCENCSA